MDENQSLFELEVDQATAEELLDTARWQRMFGLIMFSIIGLMFLAFLVGWNKMSELLNELLVAGEDGQSAMAVILVVVLLLAIIVGIMSGLLIRGAGRIKTAIRTKNQLLFNDGLGDLKSFFII